MIAEIKLSVNNVQLKEVWEIVSFPFPDITNNDHGKSMRSYLSILQDTISKIEKKLLAKKEAPGVYVMKLKYHEAHALLKTLEVLQKTFHAQRFFDQLHQRLA